MKTAIIKAKWCGDCLGLKFPDICLTYEEKLRKNLTQETCPDRESNPNQVVEHQRVKMEIWVQISAEVKFFS